MKVSSKTTYAVRAMVYLAMQQGKGVATISQMAEQGNVPPKFLEQILLILKASGMIQSKRGAKGGYMMTSRPADVSLASVVELMDESLTSDPPVATSGSALPVDVAVGEIWSAISLHARTTLQSVTLADLCSRTTELSDDESRNYMI